MPWWWMKRMDGKQFDWDDIDGRLAEQMRLTCLSSSHSIAIAVSGGADSIALCLLMARWKRELCRGKGSGELVGYVVDHRLREGSAKEALRVREWVRNLGLNCEILECKWPNGKPSSGHLQEAARYARYSLLSQACRRSGIQALLTAHHADDQAELFIMRLSRRSEIAGLAGMAFAAELPSLLSTSNCGNSSVVLLRPLLKFTKQELYAVCQQSSQAWVEDPTNANLIFTRNRIRKALEEPQYLALKKEIPKLIEYCRKMRLAIDRDRDSLLRDVGQISQDFGTVTLDVQKLVSRGLSDLVTHRAVASILQFVTQRAKPPRGRAVRMLLDRLLSGSLQGACTVGGCYVFPLSGSKGSRAMVCFSPDSPPPSGQLEEYTQLLEPISSAALCDTDKVNIPPQTVSVLRGAESSNFGEANLTDTASERLRIKKPPRSVKDFESLGLVSVGGAVLLEKLTSDLAIDTGEASLERLTGTRRLSSTVSGRMVKPISFGESQYFMDRFCVSLNLKGVDFSSLCSSDRSLGYCSFLQERPSMFIRHLKENDWQYLSDLSEGRTHKGGQGCTLTCTGKIPMAYLDNGNRLCNFSKVQRTGGSTTPLSRMLRHKFSQKLLRRPVCDRYALNYAYSISVQMAECESHRFLQAKEALAMLRSIPKPVTRSLLVLTSAHGLLLGLPFTGFVHLGGVYVQPECRVAGNKLEGVFLLAEGGNNLFGRLLDIPSNSSLWDANLFAGNPDFLVRLYLNVSHCCPLSLLPLVEGDVEWY